MSEHLSALDLAWLADRYRVREPDPCRVCGHAMTVARSGPGGTVYACGSDDARWLGKDGAARDAAYRHYQDSTQEIYSHGDGQVLALIAEVRDRRRDAGEPPLPPVDAMYDPFGGQPRYRYLGDDRFEWVAAAERPDEPSQQPS